MTIQEALRQIEFEANVTQLICDGHHHREPPVSMTIQSGATFTIRLTEDALRTLHDVERIEFVPEVAPPGGLDVFGLDPAVYEASGSEPISNLSDADRRHIMENIEDAEERGIDVLNKASRFAEELDYEVETEPLYGDPVSEITDDAEEKDFNAAFVGHRGRSEHTERILGSVAKEIVERPTILVETPEIPLEEEDKWEKANESHDRTCGEVRLCIFEFFTGFETLGDDVLDDEVQHRPRREAVSEL